MTRPTLMPLWVSMRGGSGIIVWTLLNWEDITEQWQLITDNWEG